MEIWVCREEWRTLVWETWQYTHTFFWEKSIYEISNIYDSLGSFNQLLVTSFYRRHTDKSCGCLVIMRELHFLALDIFPCVCAIEQVHIDSRHLLSVESPCSPSALVLINTQSAGKVDMAERQDIPQDSGNEVFPPKGSYPKCLTHSISCCLFLAIRFKWTQCTVWFRHFLLIGQSFCVWSVRLQQHQGISHCTMFRGSFEGKTLREWRFSLCTNSFCLWPIKHWNHFSSR